METESPAATKIGAMVIFALTCIGLLLFLWVSFGGSIPLNTQGYRFQVAFPNAFDLADQADVRIAGVSVGKVVDKALSPDKRRTLVTIELQNQFAPIRQDTSAILRQKTLLGETYVQLAPGGPGPMLRDGGRLANSQVVPTVQAYQIYNTFDPVTRRAFQLWQQTLATALGANNGENLNNAVGNLPPFATNLTQLLDVLDIQHSSVVSLIQNGGTTFDALNHSPAALRNLITSGDATFSTLASNATNLTATFHVFPTFEVQQRETLADLRKFALNSDPVVRELIPVAQELRPTLTALHQLAPHLHKLFVKLGPLITVSQTGLPATERVLKGLGPNSLLDQLGPFLEQLNPILYWIALHQQLTSDFVSAVGASLFARTVSLGGNGTGHYLRQFGPTGPETVSFASKRDSENRGNTYPPPLYLPGGDVQDYPSPQWPEGREAGWDCRNTGAPGNGDTPGSSKSLSCYTAPPLPGFGQLQGAPELYKVPAINAATYSRK